MGTPPHSEEPPEPNRGGHVPLLWIPIAGAGLETGSHLKDTADPMNNQVGCATVMAVVPAATIRRMRSPTHDLAHSASSERCMVRLTHAQDVPGESGSH